MPQFRDYPQVKSLEPTDLFLLDREGVGTEGIEAQYFLSEAIYDIAMGYYDAPPTSDTIFTFNVVRTFSLPQNLTGSMFSFEVAPSADTVLKLTNNGSLIGTIDWAAGGKLGTATFASTVTFSAGDQLRVVTPSTLNGATSLAMTFAGTRTA